MATTLTRELRPGDEGYEEARRAWNGAFDRRPAVIRQPESAAQVADAVAFGRAEGLPIAVKGGGHSVAGHSTVDDGLLIDLSRLRSVQVDPATRRVRVGGGALLGDVDRATQEHALVVPAGHVSHTGVAGLTLGGGFGWLMRRFGLTVDSLVSAEVVTADGEILRASADSEAELFWGLRGGGGNFGVVTEFEFEAHPLGPEVAVAFVLYPLEAAADVLVAADAATAQVPDEVTSFATFMTVPPAPDFPPELHGRKVLAVIAVYAGDPAEADPHLRPFRELATPLLDGTGPMPYVALQTMIDPSAPHGLHYYTRSHFLDGVDAVAQPLADVFAEVTSPLSLLLIGWAGGAVAAVPPDATPYWHRDARCFAWVVSAAPPDEPQEAHHAWVNAVSAAALPAARGVYVNAIANEGADRVRAAYGGNWDRLLAVKRRYDPENVFRLNQNIPVPA
ncbi:MAG TPA: FAD-binding oxidoreductase [Gaiellaceae bacterium]|nr:FAD-binding oxidoreductase [Gaiellaceae bacterium]